MSTKSIAEKLLIKPGTAFWVSDAKHARTIGVLPEDANPVSRIDEATVAVIFVSDEQGARTTLDALRSDLRTAATLWVAYPKGNTTDINRDSLWPIVGEYGMRPNGQVAIDETWSALRFRPLRDGEAQFTGGRTKAREA